VLLSVFVSGDPSGHQSVDLSVPTRGVEKESPMVL